jgi:hypothetical protein
MLSLKILHNFFQKKCTFGIVKVMQNFKLIKKSELNINDLIIDLLMKIFSNSWNILIKRHFKLFNEIFISTHKECH